MTLTPRKDACPGLAGAALLGAVLCVPGCGRLRYDVVASTEDGSLDRDAAATDGWTIDVASIDAAPDDASGERADARVPEAGLRDGGPDGPATVDARGDDAAAIPLVPCDWTRGISLGLIVHQAMASSVAPDSGPFVSPDGRSLFFIGGSPLLSEFRVARRTSTSVPFGSAAPAGEILPPPGTMAVSRLELSPDGREAFFSASPVPDTSGWDVWRVTRASTSVPWDPAVRADDVSTVETDGEPHLTSDGNGLWLALGWGRPGGTGGIDLFRVSRTSRGNPFGTPVPAAELNTSAHEFFPSVTADERTIVFATSRAGNYDIYYATRADPADPFDPPLPMPVITSPAPETTPFVSPDGCTLYFAAQRTDTLGDLDLYSVSIITP